MEPKTVATSRSHYELICALLRGEDRTWPDVADTLAQDDFLSACIAHGVTPLVHWHLSQRPIWHTWPDTLRAALSHYGRVQTALGVLYEQELQQVLAACADQDIDLLLMKGAPLSYTHYPGPAWRPRCDTDLLIHPRDRALIHRVLITQGYHPLPGVSGQLISHQCVYLKEGRQGVRHAYDVHWKISNAYPFSEFFAFETLYDQAIPIPPLGAHARAFSPVHALILSCIHRIAHHQNDDRLIWLYDIHLLAHRLSPVEWEAFEQLVCDTPLQRVCHLGLQRVRHDLGTVVPEPVMAWLQTSKTAKPNPSAARFSMRPPRRLQRLLTELAALPCWRYRWLLLREHAFPPSAYMLCRYATTKRTLLPVLYLHRGLRGLWRLMYGPS